MSLRYVMLELSGVCVRNHACPLCLPRDLKTNQHMDLVRLTRLVDEMRDMGVQNVTLAGFGEPMNHPDFEDIRDMLMHDFNVTITCRPMDLMMVWPIPRANVSVDSVFDARTLVETVVQADRPALPAKLVPHIVLAGEAAERIDTILPTLWTWEKEWEKISIATPVALCQDPKHREAVRKATRDHRRDWTRVKTLIHALGIARDRIALADTLWRTDACQWPETGVMINARFDLLPCCNLPATTPLGNVRDKTLQEAYDNEWWRHFREHWKEDPRCKACPDIGNTGDSK